MQMHYPTLLPDESLYNLASRFARLNGYGSHIRAIQDLTGNVKATSVANCTISYGESNQENLALYGHALYIQETLTTQLLARHLGELPSKQSEAFLESVYGLNPFWRGCQECDNQNLSLYGIKYWQRAHQLPTSIICHRHGTVLTESDLPRKRMHDRLWLPNEAPIKCKSHGTNLSIYWKMIAQIGYDGLQDKTVPHTSVAIKNAFLIALRNKGLVTNQNRLLIKKFNDSFDEFFCANFKHVMRLEAGVRTPVALLRGVVNVMNANALHRIILVYWLFGSWDFFKLSCKWIEIFKYLDEEQPANLINKNSDYEIMSSKARNACIAYMDGSVNPTRNEFIKNHYRDFNWLLKHDRNWLDRILPIIKAWKQINIFD